MGVQTDNAVILFYHTAREKARERGQFPAQKGKKTRVFVKPVFFIKPMSGSAFDDGDIGGGEFGLLHDDFLNLRPLIGGKAVALDHDIDMAVGKNRYAVFKAFGFDQGFDVTPLGS